MQVRWSDHRHDIDWQELSCLVRRAPLGDKSAAHLETVFGNSAVVCFGFDGNRLVAAGRALADGAECAYLADIVVLPEYQGRGLGTELVRRLIAAVRNHRRILLFAVPGKEGFYKRHGFRRLLTAMAIFEDESSAIARGHLES